MTRSSPSCRLLLSATVLTQTCGCVLMGVRFVDRGLAPDGVQIAAGFQSLIPMREKDWDSNRALVWNLQAIFGAPSGSSDESHVGEMSVGFAQWIGDCSPVDVMWDPVNWFIASVDDRFRSPTPPSTLERRYAWYWGAGVSSVEVERWEAGIADSDTSLGLYVHGGYWHIQKYAVIGLDVRYTLATSMYLFGEDVAAGGLRVALVVSFVGLVSSAQDLEDSR